MKLAVFRHQASKWEVGVLLFVGLCLGVPMVTHGQTAASLIDTNLVIIPTRPVEAVQTDIDNARSSKSEAEARRSLAQSLREAYDPKIELAKKEIEVIDKKRDLAKKDKRDTDLIVLDAEKKAAERTKELLVRQRELREAEEDLARSEADYASAAESAYSLELQLMKKRAEMTTSSGSGGSATSLSAMQQVAGELEGRTLKAQEEMANKLEDVAQRQRKVAERRRQLYDAGSKPGSGQ